ncbi:helicase-like transcription factor isoform X1 [Phycodurus eques]|uniref:helicase-like transcription factor isoform X1 n=2 Tax=Phycodurus eques TaxID=693459 RepID=UPI002ACEBD99|nr:helicase-like transcription factor isoform X1 [Phycodurus eques]XP_061553005.1 helicase-like transcription factor isoform X1 [Phycodurus eques]XP_061553006.1 helicase-like transcription factor isoform X1 [Phycodurus eques]XP_061553007.1 helicase-like transcription factor isoform X1 [Phycodurus eques]XP_061553008.1 helicase-like transcription factor isoform X1 [Phycodurus eques]XP_061553011.1 helicase-like transcription factor isoform X1 [Phycodurus eques]
MAFRRSWFSWDRYSEADLFTDGLGQNNTLSQAIRAAASEEPDADGNVLFGQIQGTVVGLKYYSGVVNQGEMVGLVREPQNLFDRNAVMVTNIYGSQVGHIKRELAAPMAHVMDNKLAKVEGVVHTGTKNRFSMPVILSFWGKDENKDAVTQCLARHGYKRNTGASQKLNSTGGGTALNKRGTTIPLTAEELKNAFDNLFEGLLESKEGEKEAAESVATPLLPHQRQALSWMCARENKCSLPPFWEKRGDQYYNTLTCFSAKELPERVLGGILADDMGLGKTLTTIALILTNFHEGKPLPVYKREHSSPGKANRAGPSGAAAHGLRSGPAHLEESCVPAATIKDTAKLSEKGKRTTKTTKRKHEDADVASVLCGGPASPTNLFKKKKKKRTASSILTADYYAAKSPGEALSAGATLIVCPLSVLSNWLEQFEEHVRADIKLNVYMYHGPDRNKSTKFLSSQDVVLTTYNVLASDFTSNIRSPLHDINWLRVVLDEGHVVRNPNTQMSKAVLDLRAERRWILSAVLCQVFFDLLDRPLQSGLIHRGGGTPIQNSVKDLWMLLAFLRLKPFDVREWWNRVIQRPVTQGDRAGLQNLQTLVKCITLRRSKSSELDGRPLVTLPEKSVCVEQVELSAAEREEYEVAREEGRHIIGRYVAEGTVLRNYADVLSILMRLRQHCCHPDLLASTASDAGLATTPAELRERLIEKLRVVLASGSDEECSVCLDSVRLPVITHCAHVYCRPCIAQVIGTEQESARCPLCRSDIKISELVEFPQEEMGEESGGRSPSKWRTSSKIKALIGNLLRLQREDGGAKCLVVSQFTRFLTILETPLREHGFRLVRLDGTMTQKKRTQVIQEFQSAAPSSPTIMLLSLKAGGVGLNLTAASHVFLMDPAWNPATEEQCIDRCHRLGQKRKVFVTKFIVKDSVEENMVKIQKQKQDLAEAAFGSVGADRKTSRINDIKALMEL